MPESVSRPDQERRLSAAARALHRREFRATAFGSFSLGAVLARQVAAVALKAADAASPPSGEREREQERLAEALWAYEGTPGEAWGNVDRGPTRDPIRAKAGVLLAALRSSDEQEGPNHD